MKNELRVRIRYMIRRDMPDVLAIESESFEFPWLEEDFIRCLRQRNVMGMVAEHDDKVVGFMIYDVNKTRIQVLNFATAPQFRHRGVGRQMVDVLKNKSCGRLVEWVNENNLPAQLFWRAMGFRAIEVKRGAYDDGRDAYVMEYRRRDLGPRLGGENRISRYLPRAT